MKLFALPLAKLGATPSSAPLFYLHAQRVIKAPAAGGAGAEKKSIPILSRITDKAAGQWNKLGAAKEGSWKRKLFVTGDRLMDRIEFEEWSLKAIDPALAPRPWSALSNDAGEEEWRSGGRKTLERLPLMFPGSIMEVSVLREALREQIKHREPHHKKAMIKCLIGAPLCIPFAIVPLIPNLPLFYVLWRAYSHFRAWKSSQYLSELLSTSQIHFQPSTILDDIYSHSKLSTTSDLLLTEDRVPEIVKAFEMTDEEGAALKRSVMQAQLRLEKARADGLQGEVKVEVEKTKEDVEKVKDA